MLHLRSNCSVFGGPGDVAGVADITKYETLLCACCAASWDSVAVAAPPPIVAICDGCVDGGGGNDGGCGGFSKLDGLSGGVCAVISEYCDTSGIEAVADLVSRW